MKTIKIICFAIALLFPGLLSGQNLAEYSKVLQTYYVKPDNDLLNKTIVIVNNPSTDYNRFEPLFTGFFGALFSSDPVTKNNFSLNLDKIENPDFKALFKNLTSSNIDSLYAKIPLSPESNDMNWASFFATGDTKFLDNIIANTPLAEDRTDRHLFLTGASAKWSLCANAKTDEKVKAHLTARKGNNKTIKEILKKEPNELQEEMVTVIRAQRAKGMWTEK